MSRIDVHCHVFNKDVLTIGGKILTHLGDIITDLINSGNYDDADTQIEQINAFLEMSEKQPSAIAKALLNTYGTGSIIVPLMYDMYYLTHDQKSDITDKIKDSLKRIEALGPKTEAFSGNLANIKDKVLSDIVDDSLKAKSFEIQRDALIDMERNNRGTIFPFISYDPRRLGNLDAIKANVGVDKSFRGVKLYPPLGFSAAHPAMMDKQNGLYAYCVANDIPITAHCSCPGMPTMNDHLYVPHGSLFYDGDAKTVTVMEMDEVVDFSDKSSSDKSQYFNHPDIWRKVLEAFPNLRINLAHFGGNNDEWRKLIADMINSNTYQNLYTDISCRTEPDVLKKISEYYDNSEAVQRRLMYGSDFTILLLSSDLKDFTNGIEAVFPPAKCSNVYEDNARRFLKLTP